MFFSSGVHSGLVSPSEQQAPVQAFDTWPSSEQRLKLYFSAHVKQVSNENSALAKAMIVANIYFFII